jgi:hypothetical protein
MAAAAIAHIGLPLNDSVPGFAASCFPTTTLSCPEIFLTSELGFLQSPLLRAPVVDSPETTASHSLAE